MKYPFTVQIQFYSAVLSDSQYCYVCLSASMWEKKKTFRFNF